MIDLVSILVVLQADIVVATMLLVILCKTL
jgi:hypothetical protein